MKTCKKGGCPQRAPAFCPTCVEWIPSLGSKYFRCARYMETRVTCEKTAADCLSCDHHQFIIQIGRPNFTGVDWDDPDGESKRKYMRDYMRVYRARRPG